MFSISLQSFHYYATPYPANMFWMIFVVSGVSLGIGTTIGVAILFIVQVIRTASTCISTPLYSISYLCAVPPVLYKLSLCCTPCTL